MWKKKRRKKDQVAEVQEGKEARVLQEGKDREVVIETDIVVNLVLVVVIGVDDPEVVSAKDLVIEEDQEAEIVKDREVEIERVVEDRVAVIQENEIENQEAEVGIADEAKAQNERLNQKVLLLLPGMRSLEESAELLSQKSVIKFIYSFCWD